MIDQNRFALNRSVFPRLDIAGFFELASRVGIHKVELRNDLTTGIIDGLSPEQVRSLAAKHDIRIITINRFIEFNVASQSAELPGELADLLNLAAAIDCEAIILVPSRSNSDRRSREEVYQDTVKALKALHPYFEEREVFAYIEILGFADCSIRSVVDAMNAIRESGGTRYKITYDTFHHFIGPDNTAVIEKTLDVSHIGLVHISGVTHDAPPDQYNDGHRVMVGPEDRIGNIRQLALLEKLGYNGNISFEPFAKEIQELDLRHVEEIIRESVKYVQRMVEQSVNRVAQGAS